MSVEVSPAVASPRKRRARRIVTGAGILILVAIVVPLISLGRYHRTIANSLSRGLGHTVHIGSVNLTLFPLPGLVIHDLVVEEDPAFGAEPLLRAPSVKVYPRLSSLWRERLEISRIDLDDASVNLVRDSGGRWNFSSLLLQASRTASAPTAQRRPGPTPRFPYIEFSGARINFKEGAEKRAFSLLNADASVWLADPNRWRIRLKAQPARTDLDLDLEDTGTIRLDGSVTRAASLDRLPLKLHAEWIGAQLGQISRLVFGSDSGWRGDLHAEGDITGDMANLVMSSHLRVDDAHRVEFTPINLLSLDARCVATYHHLQQSLDNLTCLLPTGDGHLLLTGLVPDLMHPQPKLSLEVNHTPVAFALRLLGLLRSGLPNLVSASGTINGRFDWGPQAETAGSAKNALPEASKEILTGHAVADTVAVSVSGIDHPFPFAALRFVTPTATQAEGPPKSTKSGARVAKHAIAEPNPPKIPVVSPNTILLESASFAAGEPKPMQVSGELTRSGFKLNFTGEGSLARLQSLASEFAQLQPLRYLAPKGSAQTDLTFAAPWVPAIDPNTGGDLKAGMQGWARIEHAQVNPAWLPEPIDITTATAQFGDGAIIWTNARISVNGIAAKGSARYSTICANPAGCPAQVSLDFPTLNAAALQSTLLGAGRHDEFLQAILSRIESPAPPWPAIKGTIHAGVLSIGKLRLTNATANIAVHDRRLNLVSLDANALGGSAHATGSIQAASGGPQYVLDIAATGVRLAAAGSLFHENWGTGSIDGHAALNLQGYSNFAASATGSFRWTVNGRWGGSWSDEPGPSLLESAQVLPPRSRKAGAQWTASGTIAEQALALAKGPAQGTISFSRKLNLEWRGSSLESATSQADPPNSVEITGTIAHPIITEPVNPEPKSSSKTAE